MYFGIDWTYIVLVLPAMLLAMLASWSVNHTFEKYSELLSSRGITGAQAARMVLDANGLQHIPVCPIAGSLTDHYDPTTSTINLSQTVYGSTSCAAIGVACHECGHAIQHATDYLPIRIRSAIIPITNLGSRLAVPLILIGILLSAISAKFAVIAYLGIACFALSAVFQLVTLPTEFDASRRALRTIEEANLLTDDEFSGAKKVLRAAAMTYVAALGVSLAQLLRFIILVGGRSNRR